MEECRYNLKLPRKMGENRFAVNNEELVLRSYQKGTRRIALRNIVSVRLTRVQGRTFCTVKAAGSPQMPIPSPALTDRAYTAEAQEQYVTFLRCLHEKITASGARPAWVGGSNLLFVLGMISCILAIISVLMYLVVLVVFGKSTPQLFFPTVFLAISGIPLLTKGKAKPYSPQELPPQYLFDD